MIEVLDYDPLWKVYFEEIKDQLDCEVSEFVESIEHVGSTSVVGLAAKPIIDIDIIIESWDCFNQVKNALGRLGYVHNGHQGVEGREAFKHASPKHKHHLYVCLKGCTALKNHLILRDHLRENLLDREKYSVLKKHLALKFSEDIESYIDGKTDFIIDILKKYQFNDNELLEINGINKKI